MNAARRATVRDLAWLLPLAAAVRIAYLLQLAASPLASYLIVDEASYDRWARAVAAGQIIGDGPFYQAPLYPYALGTWYALFGPAIQGVRAVQAGAGILTVAILYLAARRCFGRLAACVAGAGAALYAPFLFYEGQILKETWVVLLTSLLLLLLLRSDPGRRTGWLPAGIALGLLSLLRENALAYLPVLLLWILFRRPDRSGPTPPRRLRYEQGALLTAGMLLALLPAIAHNLAAGGGLLVTTSQAGTNFYIGNHAGAKGVYEPIRLGRSSPEFEGLDAQEEASRRAGRDLAPGEVSRFWFGESLRFAAQRPGEFLSLQLRKLILTWHAREIPDAWDLEFVRGLVPLLRAPLVRFGWLAPLALLGIYLARPFRREAGLLALLLLTTTAAVAIFYVFARYRLPLAPLALPFAGHAISRGRDALQAGRLRPLAAGLATVAVLFAVSHLPLAWLGLSFTDEVGHQNLGFCHLQEGDLPAAEAEFRAAIAINPDLGTAWLTLARVLEQQGRPGEQEDTLRRLLTHAAARRRQGAVILDASHESEPHLVLGARARQDGRPQEAVDHYARAAVLLPHDASPVIHQAILLRGLERTDEADAAYEEALRRDPGNPLALYNRANLRADAGDAAGARRLLAAAAATCAERQPALCGTIAAGRAALAEATP